MSEISKVGIIGSGLMGSEIACVLLFFNKSVVIKDVSSSYLENAINKCRSFLLRYFEKGKLTEKEFNLKLNFIKPTLQYEDLKDVDLVIEAVNEDIDLKIEVFKELDKICSKKTIFATNTSSFSVSKMASHTKRNENFLGMHFFYPATVMRLVEVVKTENTSDATLKGIIQLCKEIRKIPVVVKDSPGFLVNRILCALLIEAIKCYEGGVDKSVIDKSMVHPEIGLPVGPFLLADKIGLDIIYRTLEVLSNFHKDRFFIPKTIKELISQKKLGLKTNAGFYSYPRDDGNLAVEDLEIGKRIMKAAVEEAKCCENEGIADRSAIDLAMIAGAGFKRPPFAFAREYGI